MLDMPYFCNFANLFLGKKCNLLGKKCNIFGKIFHQWFILFGEVLFHYIGNSMTKCIKILFNFIGNNHSQTEKARINFYLKQFSGRLRNTGKNILHTFCTCKIAGFYIVNY